MKKNGYTIVELVIVLALFTVGYFAIAVSVSQEFRINFKEELYEEKLNAIEKQASIYAMGDEGLFEESQTAYLTVGDLALKGVIISSKDNEVVDPRNDENSLNDVKIKLTKKDDLVIAKALV